MLLLDTEGLTRRAEPPAVAPASEPAAASSGEVTRIRWVPVLVPLSAALVVASAFVIWTRPPSIG